MNGLSKSKNAYYLSYELAAFQAESQKHCLVSAEPFGHVTAEDPSLGLMPALTTYPLSTSSTADLIERSKSARERLGGPLYLEYSHTPEIEERPTAI
jgi:hypothetical protein